MFFTLSRNMGISLLMVATAALAYALTPRINLADELAPVDLKAMVPTTIGDWVELKNASAQIIDPQQKATLEKIYSETLSRTYQNRDGYRVMLSIAYGKSQKDALQLHKPEVCYPAQGFALLTQSKETLKIASIDVSTVPITRLTTSLGQRYEPVSYWTVVGGKAVQGQLNKKLTEVRFAFEGRIPDGMLVRFSSIDTRTERAFDMQDKFAKQFVESIDVIHRQRFVGSNPETL